ncbi:MAG: hypothetical protein NC218_05750 [Acetobacter sp.]|nr:hypothetical protein [Acetobacter sp.]
MENFSDVEFGSDKSTEEAPILVAQRYLNIFRQIHIFNKDKRAQFDDELLALPQNITDFFKRMPGGRLLVEHIEEVKTERGISFVKSSKEDFSDGDNSSDAPAVTTAGATAAVGGNLVLDASFAETLATSMASAFKQAPTPTVSGGADPALLSSLNKTLQLVAEEVKTSRNALIEVLKETKQITTSVVSNQNTLSKLLENLSNTYEKHSEQMMTYMSNQKESIQIQTPPHTQVQTNLPKQENHIIQTENIRIQENVSSPQNSVIERSTADAPIEGTVDNVRKKKKKKKHNNSNNQTPMTPQERVEPSHLQTQSFKSNNLQPQKDITVKSEKIAPAFGGIIRNVASKHIDEFKNVRLDEPPFEDISFEDVSNIAAEPVIESAPTFSNRNIAHNNEQTIQRNATTTSATMQENSFEALFDREEVTTPQASSIVAEQSDKLDSLMADDGLDFALPEQNISAEPEQETVSGLDSLMTDDGLDFALPEQNISVEPEQEAVSGLDSLMTDDGLDFALPEQNITAEAEQETVSGLDSLMTDDGLDFALPEQNVTAEAEQETVSGLDSLMTDDGLDFALPEQNISVEPEQETVSGLDSLMTDDGLDFALPEQNISAESEQETVSGLDSLMTDDGLDFALPEQNVTAEAEQETVSGLDSLMTENEFISDSTAGLGDLDTFITPDETVIQTPQNRTQSVTPNESQSRYSEELNKIRAALTSDNIDISSIEQPIALDDYSDDENVHDDINDILMETSQETSNEATHTSTDNSSEEEWEWEYVDENGNPIEASDEEDGDWEWEYVEDDSDENNNK